jgi:hypothetical protein
MSSKPHHTATAEKSSDPYPSGVETSAFNYCPHCGGPLDEGLAQHMARGRCQEYTSPNNQSPPKPEPTTISPPTLDNHDAYGAVDEDELEQRRALADELAEAGVWPGE